MYVLFDIGATNCRVGVSTDGVTLGEFKQEKTPAKFSDGMALIKKMAGELAGGEEIKGAAGGVAGSLDEKKASFVYSKLTDWVGKPLREELFAILQCPIHVENDTATVGLGEAHFGAAKGANVAVYITVSTGIGGVKIVDGYVDESAFGFEPGHQIINFAEAGTETRGEFENYASGTALQKKYGKIPSDIHDADIWKEHARLLAVGLYNTILHWSPSVLVLGGGVVVHAGLDLAEVAKQLESLNKIFPRLPEIKKSTLEDLGGLYGGMVLLSKSHRPKW